MPSRLTLIQKWSAKQKSEVLQNCAHIANILIVIFVIPSLILTVVKINQDTNVHKTSVTIDYVQQYNNKLINVRKSIYGSKTSFSRKISKKSEIRNRKALNDYVLKEIQNEKKENKGIETDLLVLFSYYENLGLCVKEKSCIKKYINSNIINDGKRFYNLFWPFILDYQKREKTDFGEHGFQLLFPKIAKNTTFYDYMSKELKKSTSNKK